MKLILGGLLLPVWLLGMGILLPHSAWGQTPDDQFMRGYAAAVLAEQFQIQTASIVVHDGTITLRAQELGDANQADLKTALLKIEGVHQVVIADGGEAAESITIQSEPDPSPHPGGELLPDGHLFRPLMGDPRWPHFSAAWLFYQNNDELANVGAVSLGTTIPIYENNFWGDTGRWSLGIEGAVFSIFDLDAKSADQINSDYLVGIPFSYAQEDFSAMFRFFHQSSHLGDEFLLRNPVTRIDFDYEAVDFRASYDFFDQAVRVYGGAGYLVNKNPNKLNPLTLQGGFEMNCPRVFFKYLRPVAALDIQTWEENDWALDWSARAGVQLDAEKLKGRALLIMLEYFHGHSPNGQFFQRNIEYFGVGVHFYL